MPTLDLNTLPTISIGVAAKILRISVSSIRMYESEGLILLNRDSNGHRLLTVKDIERINCIKNRIVNEGYNFEGLRRLLALIPCWEIISCNESDRERCPAFNDHTTPCWSLHNSVCAMKGINCYDCEVYINAPACSDNFKEYLKKIPYLTNK